MKAAEAKCSQWRTVTFGEPSPLKRSPATTTAQNNCGSAKRGGTGKASTHSREMSKRLSLESERRSQAAQSVMICDQCIDVCAQMVGDRRAGKS